MTGHPNHVADDDMFDFAPEAVTVTMDPEAHAALEALLVAVAHWYDTESGYTVRYGSTAKDLLHNRYRQYRDALDAAEAL